MTLTRRAFLQQVSLALAAAGISQADFGVLTRRYQQALAQPTRRKLALLIGINPYSEQVSDYPLADLRNNRSALRGTTLNGCLTDVELQRELLIHRFGFQPSDIVSLVDQQATRQAIESAFLDHLTAQARPGDVVVIHFSGLGSRVQLGNDATTLHNSLVPVDGWLPTERNPTINDLLEDTLVLLVRSLATDQVTTVLDVSYGDPGRWLQGNWRVRSRLSTPNGQPNAEELALQAQLLSQRQSHQWQNSPFPGVWLTAARTGQGAIEGQWNGFSAGLFTYALTQQLWWATPETPLWVTVNRSKAIVKQWVGDEQQPQLTAQSNRAQPLPYYTHPVLSKADGVVIATEEDGKVLQLWLAGLPPDVLEHYGTNSLLTLGEITPEQSIAALTQDAGKASAPVLQIRSREGLIFRAKSCCTEGAVLPNAIGQPVREAVRLLPRNIGLTVALDSTLERIERVDATSAFAGLTPKVTIATAEQPADYIFGKLQPFRTLTAALPNEAVPDANTLASARAGYGLFNLGRVAVPNTIASTEEAIKTAVSRIAPHLRTLLGTKLLRLTANQGSSQLGVRVSLERVASQPQVIFQQETGRVSSPNFALWRSENGSEVNLSSADPIRYRIENQDDRAIYALLLSVDSGGNAIAFHGVANGAATAPDHATTGFMILPQETLLLPQGAIAADWTMQTPGGLTESWIICSRSPFTLTSALLEAGKLPNSSRQVVVLSNWLEVAQAILQDLHHASLTTAQDTPDSYVLDVNAWATFNVLYRVV